MAAVAPPICVYIISHGSYSKSKRKFTIPPNINLIQYSTPTNSLSVFEAEYIYRKKCELVKEPLYVINKYTGKIYKSSYKYNITAPREQTSNLQLRFTVGEFLNIKLGISYPDGTSYIPATPEEITLEDILHLISDKYRENTINVVQLSCRVGSYSKGNIDELTRQFKALGIHSYGQISDTDIPLDVDNFEITTDEKQAIKKSAAIRRKDETAKRRKSELKQWPPEPSVSRTRRWKYSRKISDTKRSKRIAKRRELATIGEGEGGKPYKSKTRKHKRKYKRTHKRKHKRKHKKVRRYKKSK